MEEPFSLKTPVIGKFIFDLAYIFLSEFDFYSWSSFARLLMFFRKFYIWLYWCKICYEVTAALISSEEYRPLNLASPFWFFLRSLCSNALVAALFPVANRKSTPWTRSWVTNWLYLVARDLTLLCMMDSWFSLVVLFLRSISDCTKAGS